jgi:hypothetical protein
MFLRTYSCLSLFLIFGVTTISAQNFSGDARKIGMGGIGYSDNIATGMVDDERDCTSILLPLGLFQLLQDTDRFNPDKDAFDPIFALEGTANPLHYIFDRNPEGNRGKFVADLVDGELSRDLNTYRGFVPTNSLTAEGPTAFMPMSASPPMTVCDLSGDADAGMDAEAGNGRTAGTRRQGTFFGSHFVPHSRYAYAGSRSRRHALRDRGAVEFAEQRSVAPKATRLVRIRFRPQTAFLNEPCDTAMNALHHMGNFLTRRRGHTPERQFSFAAHHIDDIQNQYMEMGIKVQRIAEALNEGHGAATSLSVRGRNARPAAD